MRGEYYITLVIQNYLNPKPKHNNNEKISPRRNIPAHYTVTCVCAKLITDGGFENTKTYDYANNKSTGELPRISALGKLGSNTETNNPVMEAETVVPGSWYRKSANSGYNHGKIVTDDYAEGEKALNLSITAGSTTTKLDTWDNKYRYSICHNRSYQTICSKI